MAICLKSNWLLLQLLNITLPHTGFEVTPTEEMRNNVYSMLLSSQRFVVLRISHSNSLFHAKIPKLRKVPFGASIKWNNDKLK